MNALPVREVFISLSRRRQLHKREHENLIFLPAFWEAYWCSPGTVCLQVRAAGIPIGSCMCKSVWAEVQTGKPEKLMTGSTRWKAEQSSEKHGWRGMGIRWLNRKAAAEKTNFQKVQKKNLVRYWLTRNFYTTPHVLPKCNTLAQYSSVQLWHSALEKKNNASWMIFSFGYLLLASILAGKHLCMPLQYFIQIPSIWLYLINLKVTPKQNTNPASRNSPVVL